MTAANPTKADLLAQLDSISGKLDLLDELIGKMQEILDDLSHPVPTPAPAPARRRTLADRIRGQQ